VTDLNIPVLVTWEYQDGRIGGSISFSSYAAALKHIDDKQASRFPLGQIKFYYIESNAPELAFKRCYES
jgi:hypothetical protein